MPTDREKSVALTEAAFRIANERMAGWEERHHDGAPALYICECASQPCRERVLLSREEYEAVRADPKRFLVTPGHVLPELEEVVESFAEYQVIQKPGALMDLLVETDPREPQSGSAEDAARTLADKIAAAADA